MDPERDEVISTFCSISGADATAAEHLLEAHGWDLERGLNFYLENGGAGIAAHQATRLPAPQQRRYQTVDEEPVVVDPPEPSHQAGGSRLPRIVDTHDNPQAFDLTGDDDGFDQQFQEPALTFGRGNHRQQHQVAQPSQAADDVQVLEEEGDLAVLARHRANRVARDEDVGDDGNAAAASGAYAAQPSIGPNHPRVRGNRRAAARTAGDEAAMVVDPDLVEDPDYLPGVGPREGGAFAGPGPGLGGLAAALGAAGGGYGGIGGADLGGGIGPGDFGGVGIGGGGIGGVGGGGRDADLPDLPEGINVEEARMLEAAMLGVPYEGRMPDFSQQGLAQQQAAAAAVDPELLQRQYLRQEQDDAYEESLRSDREKQAERERERAEAERVRVEQEEAQREEAQRKEAQERQYQRTISSKEASLPAEPQADDPDAVSVLIRLPGGGRCSRRFLRSDRLARLFDFVDVANTGSGLLPGSYRVVAQFPRRVFEEGDERTLGEAGLDHKQEALMLEML